jgi:undecaprenyl-diphosphatase
MNQNLGKVLQRPLRFAASAIILFLLVIALGYAVDKGYLYAFDLPVSHLLNLKRGISPDWLILAAQLISWVGGGVQRFIIIGLLAIALWRWWGWGAALAMSAASVVSVFTSEQLKQFFARPRPDLVPHLENITSAAYPSGHSTNAAVVYVLFIMLVPQARRPGWKIAAGVMILLTGLSRIMLGVHWPTDVIGGWMLGIAFAVSTGAIIAWREQYNPAKRHATLLT